jgi:hypothetical protein
VLDQRTPGKEIKKNKKIFVGCQVRAPGKENLKKLKNYLPGASGPDTRQRNGTV